MDTYFNHVQVTCNLFFVIFTILIHINLMMYALDFVCYFATVRQIKMIQMPVVFWWWYFDFKLFNRKFSPVFIIVALKPEKCFSKVAWVQLMLFIGHARYSSIALWTKCECVMPKKVVDSLMYCLYLLILYYDTLITAITLISLLDNRCKN